MRRWLVIVVLAFLLPGYSAAVGAQVQPDVLAWSAKKATFSMAESASETGDPSQGHDGSDELMPQTPLSGVAQSGLMMQDAALTAWVPPFIEGVMRPPSGA